MFDYTLRIFSQQFARFCVCLCDLLKLAIFIRRNQVVFSYSMFYILYVSFPFIRSNQNHCLFGAFDLFPLKLHKSNLNRSIACYVISISQARVSIGIFFPSIIYFDEQF